MSWKLIFFLLNVLWIFSHAFKHCLCSVLSHQFILLFPFCRFPCHSCKYRKPCILDFSVLPQCYMFYSVVSQNTSIYVKLCFPNCRVRKFNHLTYSDWQCSSLSVFQTGSRSSLRGKWGSRTHLSYICGIWYVLKGMWIWCKHWWFSTLCPQLSSAMTLRQLRHFGILVVTWKYSVTQSGKFLLGVYKGKCYFLFWYLTKYLKFPSIFFRTVKIGCS